MILRWLCLVLLSTLVISAQTAQVPLATFRGTVHGVSNKRITIETAEGNLVDFDINRKTKVLRAKKQIAVSELKTGDPVAIDAREEFGEYLIAVVITMGAKN